MPLYAWAQTMRKHTNTGRPGKLVQLLTTLIANYLAMGPRANQLFYKLSTGRGATDASAHCDSSTIGGWWLDDPSADKPEATWFMEEANHKATPWLFHNNQDYKRSISALELLGTAMLLKVLTDRNDHKDILVQAPVKTDSEDNAYALLQNSSTAWPQCAILAEIAALSGLYFDLLTNTGSSIPGQMT